MNLKITSEIGAALGAFLHGGKGPSHSAIGRVFQQSGYGEADPGPENANKEHRVLAVSTQAVKKPTNSRKLVELLLDELRLSGAFDSEYKQDPVSKRDVVNLSNAFSHIGWGLSSDGRLESSIYINLETGGRDALLEQLDRLRRNIDDPAAILGGAKDLLESISKFVLEENNRLPSAKLDFPAYYAQATELLGMRPKDIDASTPGGKQAREIFQAAQTTALNLNELRNLQGTGHGRTLPTGVTVETARFVIRTGTHVAELMLSTHDRMMAR